MFDRNLCKAVISLLLVSLLRYYPASNNCAVLRVDWTDFLFIAQASSVPRLGSFTLKLKSYRRLTRTQIDILHISYHHHCEGQYEVYIHIEGAF